MKTRYRLRPLPAQVALPALFIALAGSAAAHPGNHSHDSSTWSGLLHVLTQFEHIGPVIAAALLLLACSRRNRAACSDRREASPNLAKEIP